MRDPHAPKPPARPAKATDASGPHRSANGVMSVREAGRLGGQARKQQLGREGYSALGHRGVDALREQRGPDAMAVIGREGGQVRRREIGREGYAQMGRQGGRRVRELVARGRQAEDGDPVRE